MSEYICATCQQPTMNRKGHAGNPWACITALMRKVDEIENWIKVTKFWQKQGKCKDKQIAELQVIMGLLLQGHRFTLSRYEELGIPILKETKTALRKQAFEAIKTDILARRSKIMKALAE